MGWPDQSNWRTRNARSPTRLYWFVYELHEMLKSMYNLVTKGKTFFLTRTYKLVISICSFVLLHRTYSIFNAVGTITISNINKKDKNSFSFVLSWIFLLLTFAISLVLFIDSFLSDIFVGVLPDMTMPAPSSGFTLSSSQNRVFQYICNILSTVEPISSDYVDQELDENEQYTVSETSV